jgi:hypothetical protein
MISVDLDKAKEITKNVIRHRRKALLVEQDVLFQRALETQADTSSVVAEKQRLRDLPANADSKTTTTQLKNLMNNM